MKKVKAGKEGRRGSLTERIKERVKEEWREDSTKIKSK